MDIIYEKWDAILEEVKREHELSEVSFVTWLQPLTIHKIEDHIVYILVPSQQMGVDYINRKYALPLKVAISELTHETYDIKLLLPDDIKKEDAAKKTAAAAVSSNNKRDAANLNPKYTFDTFVVGNNNKFAHAASLAVAESPGEVYNPLFLYGGVGLGKTHLMHSIAHFILDKDPDAKILYTTSEQFTNDLIDSIRKGRRNSDDESVMEEFREKYRNVDVLLIDDIQFIIGKESTQEEFFHTFNDLHSAKKQIIISSDKPPKDMDILEDRIRSRFEWGLVADISSPDYETRMAILQKKEEMDGYKLDDEIIDYIAQNVKSNIRELEGALNKIIAYANLEQKPITLELTKTVLKDIISPNEKKVITTDFIINTVAQHFDVTVADIVGSRRNSKIVYPRQIAMYLCREMISNIPLKSIGESMGNRDHTTIMHGCEKIEQELETSEETRKTIDILKKKLS